MKLKRFVAAAAIACATALPALAQELKFANFTPPFHTINASVIEVLNAHMSEATGGAVTVRGYHGGELGAGPVEQYVRALQGVADITWGLPGYTSSQFGKTMIAELPGVVPDGVYGYEVIWPVFEEHLADEFPGVKVLAIWNSEPNIMIMRDKVIRTPADLAGLKIRVAGATAAEVVSALGATPVQMPINEVYNSLQTGLIDGVFTGSSTLSDFKLDEVASSYTFGAPLGRLTFYTVMNQGVYDSLSDEQKAALDEIAGPELSKSAELAWNKTSDEAVAAARASGDNTFVDLTPEQAQAFADLIAPVNQAYIDAVDGQAAYDAMTAE